MKVVHSEKRSSIACLVAFLIPCLILYLAHVLTVDQDKGLTMALTVSFVLIVILTVGAALIEDKIQGFNQKPIIDFIEIFIKCSFVFCILYYVGNYIFRLQ